MNTPQKLSFSIILTLMLIQTALSVPVEAKNKSKVVDPKNNELLFLKTYNNLTDLLKNLVEQESNIVKAKIDNFLTHINSTESSRKLKDLLVELLNHKLTVTSRNFSESMSKFVKQELKEVKTKFDNFLSDINLPEPIKKDKQLLVELSGKKFVETYRNLTEQITNLVGVESTVIKDKIADVLTHINSVETNKSWKYLFAGQTNQQLAETSKILTERLTKLIKHELDNVNVIFDKLLTYVNSVGASKNLLEQFSDQKIAETYKNLKERLTNLIKQEFRDVMAKAYDALNDKNLNITNKNIEDLLAELSDQKLAETYKDLNERLTYLVKKNLVDLKANVYDIVTLASSANRKKRQGS